jgi:hypothetical protein
LSYLYESGETVGNQDSAVSPYLKTWISDGSTVVCGVTGEGTSKDIQANWDSPFEGEDVGSKFEKTGGVAQALSNQTSKSTFSSIQIWNGNRPTQFNVVLQLYALSNPEVEVKQALIALEQMVSPQVKDVSPGGRIPNRVVINIGRRAIYPECVIESVSVPMDKEVDSQGRLIRAEVTLQVATLKMLNRSDIAARYG